MTNGILFLVLPESTVAKVRTVVRELIVPDECQFVQILSDTGAATLCTDVKSRTAQDLIGRIAVYPQHEDNKLIVGHEVQCSIADLTYWWETHDFGASDVQKLKPKAVIRAVKEHLEKTGRHWRVHAMAQMRRFDGPTGNLDSWMQQFGELGCTDIGRKIAAKLRVIRTGDLARGSFATRAADLIGHRKASCYVQDDDAGGSWLEMQAILTHACPPETVFPVRWDKAVGRLFFPNVTVDEFVIHEDGLWSGREAVRRLLAIKAEPPSAPVTFRFGVVTDFGLMVARQAIRSLDLGGRVSIDASASELIGFIKHGIPATLALGLDMPSENYFAELHCHLQPFAFSISEDWTADEIRICEEIGRQLVRHWLSRHLIEPPSTEKVECFALGGGRFASTVVFSRSVPKVCLPLLWLDGPVELYGKHLSWKPLLVDARRVSDGSLLLAAAMNTPT
ncbi:MAG: hypothetical protein WKF52_06385 [Sphingomicrobium sp.]